MSRRRRDARGGAPGVRTCPSRGAVRMTPSCSVTCVFGPSLSCPGFPLLGNHPSYYAVAVTGVEKVREWWLCPMTHADSAPPVFTRWHACSSPPHIGQHAPPRRRLLPAQPVDKVRRQHSQGLHVLRQLLPTAGTPAAPPCPARHRPDARRRCPCALAPAGQLAGGASRREHRPDGLLGRLPARGCRRPGSWAT
jgi:hypothetical protein